MSVCLDDDYVYSESLMACLVSTNPDRKNLKYEYLLKLKPHASKDNHMHYGTCHLMVELERGRVREPIIGDYYTDRGRQSFGEIFLFRSSQPELKNRG